MANNKEQYLSRDGVSHLYLLIKNKLTTYFKTLFVSKKDGYDLSQNDFTNELKAKLENMSSSGGSGGGSAEKEIIIIEPETFDDETMIGTISQETADILNNYTGGKLLYFNLLDVYLIPFSGTSPSGYRFTLVSGNSFMQIDIDTYDLTANFQYEEFITSDENGKIPVYLLPDLGFYDDVIEGYYKPSDGLFYSYYNTQLEGDDRFVNKITGETGKIYVDIHTSNTYRWSGTMFVKLESSAGLTALTNTEIDEIIASVDSSTE